MPPLRSPRTPATSPPSLHLIAWIPRRRGRIMAKLDADKNGTISRAELDRAVEEMIAAADADHDGGVTLSEAQNFRLAKIKKPATGEQSN